MLGRTAVHEDPNGLSAWVRMEGVSLEPGETGCLVLTSGYEVTVYKQKGLAEYRGCMPQAYSTHSATYEVN